jgi:hypothetical protein
MGRILRNNRKHAVTALHINIYNYISLTYSLYTMQLIITALIKRCKPYNRFEIWKISATEPMKSHHSSNNHSIKLRNILSNESTKFVYLRSMNDFYFCY